jgi:hypothetical protein
MADPGLVIERRIVLLVIGLTLLIWSNQTVYELGVLGF